MVWTIYVFILFYFLLGSIGFYYINKRKSAEETHNNVVKLATYFGIVNVLFFSIILYPVVFRFIAMIIIIAGCFEIIIIFVRSAYSKKSLFLSSLFVFGIFSFAFYSFSGMDKDIILFTFLIVFIFDSFSQITGQLWGRKKLFIHISPNKTIEGLSGGAVIAIISSYFLKDLTGYSAGNSIWLAIGIIFFAFFGDLMASLYKRKFNKKDYSRLISGHGGFLDRFDSFITGGAWIAFMLYI